MRLGSTTLILRPKSRVYNGSTLAHPSKEIKVSSAVKVMASVFFFFFFFFCNILDIIMVDYLEVRRSHDKWCILCRRTKGTASEDCKKKKRKVDLRCSALAR